MVTVKVKKETRKGPWTEEEDLQLVCFVRLLGDRRWDFIAKVSGLNRTGKSCRLRWVNYLHPGLKRGRMTPQEERVVIELHSRWGNRWSRIARKLPGRTDNEIKNYWRTHMRKKAQERRRVDAAAASPAPSSSSSTSCLLDEPYRLVEPGTAQIGAAAAPSVGGVPTGGADVPMDQIWKEIAPADVIELASCYDEAAAACDLAGMAASPPWGGYPYGSLWKMDDEDLRMLAAPCCPAGLSAPN